MNALTYSFSRREKVLITVFSILLVGLAWYEFVYVITSQQMAELDSRIQTTQSNIDADNTKLAQKRQMQHTIEQRKAAGVKAKPIPTYDNLEPLMGELDVIMAETENYTMSFDALDTESTSYVLRGIGIQFGTTSYEDAVSIVTQIADGTYPCIIDSLSIGEHITVNTGIVPSEKKNSTTADFSTTMHVVFFERPIDETTA